VVDHSSSQSLRACSMLLRRPADIPVNFYDALKG
jgi:hypothetical protein